jgi:Cytochrome c7 and related cytochrome c
MNPPRSDSPRFLPLTFVPLFGLLSLVACGRGASEEMSAELRLQPSALVAALADAGVDLRQPPALDALTRAQRKAVMSSFTQALGVPCTGCHVEGHFDQPTPRLRAAEKMWNDYVTGLSLADGSPLYCDSCHQGQATFLDRSEEKTLKGFMRENYVKGMRQRDGSAVSCATCHGEPFNGDLLDEAEGAHEG